MMSFLSHHWQEKRVIGKQEVCVLSKHVYYAALNYTIIPNQEFLDLISQKIRKLFTEQTLLILHLGQIFRLWQLRPFFSHQARTFPKSYDS